MGVSRTVWRNFGPLSPRFMPAQTGIRGWGHSKSTRLDGTIDSNGENRKACSVTLGEGFLLLVRWFHALAAVAWIGGSIFYVLVLRPAQRRAGGQEFTVGAVAVGHEVQSQFRGLVDSCIAVLLVTGAVMLFDRLTDATTGTTYVVVVAVKIGLALWMFAMAQNRWRRRRASVAWTGTPDAQRSKLSRAMALMSGVNLSVILGIAIFFLSDLLRFIFERGLTGG